jgi:hypothetical protein
MTIIRHISRPPAEPFAKADGDALASQVNRPVSAASGVA